MFSCLTKARDILWDVLFPPTCLNCQKPATDSENKLICRRCLCSININNTLFCAVCRARLPYNKKTCHKDSPYVLAAATDYSDEPIRNLLRTFKYKSVKSLSFIIGEILTNYLSRIAASLSIDSFILVPIPLHPRRERQRGFNQAEILAQALGSYFKLTLIYALKRVKDNKPQVQLKDFDEREKNVSGCFAVVDTKNIENKNIILVDDVFTSGATMNEAVKILKSAGARKVIALVVSKA